MEPIDINCSKLNNLLLAELKKVTIKDVTLDDPDNSPDELCFGFIPMRHPSPDELKSMKSGNSIAIGKKLYVEVNTSFYKYRISKTGKKTYLKDGLSKLPFKSLSLQFYHDKMLLCKADWACVFNSSGNQDEHPQPHWHFDPEVIIKHVGKNAVTDVNTKVPPFTEVLQSEKPVIPAFNPNANQNVVDDSDPKVPYPLVKIHFATSSGWPVNKDENPVISEESLRHWFSHCLCSIKAEHQKYL